VPDVMRTARALGVTVRRLRHGRLPRPVTNCLLCGRLLPPGGVHACAPVVAPPPLSPTPLALATGVARVEAATVLAPPTAPDAPAEVADDCPGCRELSTYLRTHELVRGEVHCDECGSSVRLQKRRARRPAQPARVDERAWRARTDETLADLGLIAKWRPTWSAAALAPSPVVGDGNRGGGAKREAADRSARVDDAHDEMRVARALDDKLQLLCARGRALGGATERAAAVLCWIVERCGKDRLNRVDLSELVGVNFAEQKTVDAWAKTGDLRDSSREHGLPLVRAAVALWCGVEEDAAARGAEP